METFFALVAFCAGNSPVVGEFPSQTPVTRSFDIFFDLHPNKRLSKQLRHHRVNYDLTVMARDEALLSRAIFCDILNR